ncbi:hypothetical protein QWJ34_12480 [Saccharibacillus sp. CPCC 101409]|uniref:hypothetical protein n=1 Tax=Saccharibacillus sp. CPCC 101409 TaxID=3058041 RepID=UPI002672EFEC|nr:hypothetical protein [Saccharibacillus sp. CPCC 101409]MDO3410580.1 hypothetical protein [Saccharibacillus sp. CPCC 101409]
MKKTAGILIVLLAVAAVVLIFNRDREDSAPLTYIKSESTHSRFEITAGGEVIFTENIHIQNLGDTRLRFKVTGVYSDDFRQGLLTTERLNGYTGSDRREILELPAHTEQTFTIDFIGSQGTAAEKQDRNPPEEIVFSLVEGGEN